MVDTVSFNELDIRQCLIYSSVILAEKQRASNASVYRGRVHEDFNIELHTKIHLKDLFP